MLLTHDQFGSYQTEIRASSSSLLQSLFDSLLWSVWSYDPVTQMYRFAENQFKHENSLLSWSRCCCPDVRVFTGGDVERNLLQMSPCETNPIMAVYQSALNHKHAQIPLALKLKTSDFFFLKTKGCLGKGSVYRKQKLHRQTICVQNHSLGSLFPTHSLRNSI